MKIYVDGNPREVCCVRESLEGMLEGPERAPIDGTNTNNIAEYRAILFGLYKHPEVTEVMSDSQLAVKQLNGEYAVKSQSLLPYWYKVKARVERLGHGVRFTWVPRSENPAGEILG